ncbi:FAD-binding oxidoreductase [Oceanobacillus chungangensis]|uniref:FAD-binding oxidoreductase n=1 Tax=Oceanobacillus chungangensis TaxID=1229152 RepID=A0A3D8PIH5_9BACI|nr:FAD-binding oxidoreductase [Oceanobacillus chungangensis]RDW15442.1 FAD-binding oxidoreductase [Oceanobacillus chungangensis]
MSIETIIGDPVRLLLGDKISDAYKQDIYVPKVADVHAVALAKTTDEVRKLVNYAIEQDLKIIARGAGTGVAGAQVPIHGNELIIDVSQMKQIVGFDEATMTLTVEPGVLLSEIQEYVESRGYFYPPDPGSKHSTIGGNVATNAGGMRAVKYGTTRDYVRAIEVVLPTGETVELGSLNIKSSSGYDLKNLLIGSEGTLGIITQIKLKVLPLPKYKQSVLLAFDSVTSATDGVLTILANGIDPTALELFERGTIVYSETFTKQLLPLQTGEAYVLMTLDGNEMATVTSRADVVKQLLQSKAIAVLALDVEQEKLAWKLRDHILVALMEFTEFEMLDEVVPINRFAEMISYTKELQGKHGISVINFGHAGDGNIHTVLMREGLDQETWIAKREALLTDLYEKVAALGGLPSAEHGIGIIKKSYFEKMIHPVELNLMRKVKNAIDPDNRLNPGKLL